MIPHMEGKSRVYSVRVPIDLDERLQRIKEEQAHKRVPNAELLVEAIRLYVEHAERYGIDDNLVVKEPALPYPIKRTGQDGSRAAPSHKKTGNHDG